ncbi:MAG: heme exporter protein CcmB [Acidimicrobiia bacterium]
MSLPRQVSALMRFELRDELRAGEVGLIVLPFAAVALLIIPMAVGIDTPLLARIGPGIYWSIVLLFGIVVTQRQSAVANPAARDMLRLLAVDPAARFAASALASTMLLLAFEIAAGGITLLLYDPTLQSWWWLVVLLPLTAAGLAMIGTIAGNIASGLETRSSLVPLMVAPVAVPVLLGAAQATEGLRVGSGILRWVLLLAIVDTVLAVAGVLTARPLEESAS